MAKLNFVSKIVKNVNYIDDYHYISKAKIILEDTKNLRLVGETGTGKTTLVYYLSKILNLPLFETVLTRDSSRWDLLASDTLTKGETKVRKGLILAWLEAEEGILYLDGFNYAEPNIVSLIESLADFRGNILIPELNQMFKRGNRHYIVISYNPSEKASYSGTLVENIATIRRFEGLVIRYMNESSETKLLQKFYKGNDSYNWCRKFVELGSKTRTLYQQGEFCTPITTGNLINYAKFKTSGLADAEIIEIASSLFKETQRDTFKRMFEDIKKTQARKIP